MTNTEISRMDFEDIIQDFPYGSVREKYSGRGMYGATCVGIVTDANPEYLKGILRRSIEQLNEDIESDVDDFDCAVEAEQVEVMESLLVRMRWDSMGLDTIVYFPGISVT